jgi:acetyl-CoA/propionyl-CoA carboxylase carboxyl transferase subunit
MNSKDLGADRVFAWPSAEIGIMGAGSAVRIIHRRELERTPGDHALGARLAAEYAARHLSAQRAFDLGLVDAVIEPEETRARLVEAFSHVAACRRASWSVPRAPLRTAARR